MKNRSLLPLKNGGISNAELWSMTAMEIVLLESITVNARSFPGSRLRDIQRWSTLI